MSSWDIDVRASAGTIERSMATANNYMLVHTRLADVASRAGGDLANSQPVFVALNELFAEVVQPDTEAVDNRTGSAITQTTLALQHYREGDLTMAAQAQEAAGEATTPAALPGEGGD